MTEESADQLKERIMAEKEVPTGTCSNCHSEVERYRRHDRRKRTWWINRAGIVIKVLGFISRFFCPHCSHRFTFHPSYSLGNRKYVKPDIEQMSQSYLEEGAATLFTTLKEHSVPQHKEPFPGHSESFTARSTLWRWMEIWGCEPAKTFLHKLKDWICRANPDSIIHRFIPSISPHKWRSAERKKLLENARHLFVALHERIKIEIRKNSPHCATGAFGG